MPHIRPLAICLFRHNGTILVSEERDPAKDEIFYRPLGGGIEFGEHSAEALRRELMEEIGAEVKDLVYLGTLENIFTFNGKPGHEIVQVYDGALVESGLYEQAVISGHEADVNLSMRVIWKCLNEFGPGKSILYPDGLLEMLSGQCRNHMKL
jgi:8-oxo-dGTP pyrophosphatase MutT (NUDIX family)